MEELAEIMASCCGENGHKEVAIGGYYDSNAVVSLYHGQWVGLSFPVHHPRTKVTRQYIKMYHIEVGIQQRARGASRGVRLLGWVGG